MKNKHFTLLALLLAFCLGTHAQCVIPINEGESYLEDFESGQMECWNVENTGTGTWSLMAGTSSTVVIFQNGSTGDEGRLISPTFDMSGISSATFSFTYAMVSLDAYDELVVSYRTSESDSWHELGSFSFSDWSNYYEETYDLPEVSPTYQVSFLARSNGGYYIVVDNIEIVGAGGCARPVNLQATEITPNSALIGWSTTGNEESWTVETNGNQKLVETQPFLLEGLTELTEYTFRVKANCGDGVESEWSMPVSFRTLCDVITVTDDEPFFDDFEGSEDFLCWTTEIISGDDDWVVDPGYTILNNTAFFIWLGGEANLYSTPFDLTAVTNPTLNFKHRQRLGNDGTVDELIVGYRTSPEDTWHSLMSFTDVAPTWEDVEIALPNPSATYQLIFVGIAHNGDGVYVDEVRVGNRITTGVSEKMSVTADVNPNPTNGQVTVTANIVDGEVVVYDLFGKQVATAKMTNGQADIDLSDVARGVYMARVNGTEGTATIKLVKE